MTVVTDPRRAVPRQRGLKSLVGVMGFVCLVLFLLAIEQKQAVQAWAAVREGAAPAAGRIAGWVGDGASDGLSGLRRAAAGSGGPAAAAARDAVLAGEFGPGDEATRAAVGGVGFTGATIRFETGGVLRTQPLRIASGREAFTFGQTFAARLNAREDAQIELRRVIPAERERAVDPSPPSPSSSLCAGRAPGVVALLHRGDRVDMMLFRERTIVGADAPPNALCGVWSFRAR
jgi:hypothetical protein